MPDVRPCASTADVHQRLEPFGPPVTSSIVSRRSPHHADPRVCLLCTATSGPCLSHLIGFPLPLLVHRPRRRSASPGSGQHCGPVVWPRPIVRSSARGFRCPPSFEAAPSFSHARV